MFSVKIDDQEIGNLIKIKNVNRQGLPSSVNELKSYNLVDGGRFLRKKYDSRQISIDFVCTGEVDKKYEALKKILMNSEQFKIVFGDYEDRYFTATLDRDSTFDKMTNRFATGTINLIAPYPFAKANNEVEYTSASDKIVFDNTKGTSKAYPRFQFTAQSNFNMFGFSAPNGGLIQFGYEGANEPYIRAGEVFKYDTATNAVYINGKRKYISEGKPFSIPAGKVVEVGLTFSGNASQPVQGFLRSEFI